MLENYKFKVWEKAINANNNNILKLVEKKADAKLLDLGCGDGKWALKVANKIETEYIYGLKLVGQL